MTDPADTRWKNTFIPYLKNREISTNGIIDLLRLGWFPFEKLPPEIQQAVRDEMSWRKVQESYR
jgi:hypothetical protein